MMQITSKTSIREISDYISELREEKGKEKEVLEIIKKASGIGNDFVVNLFWEKALTYQHLIMNEDARGENKDIKLRSEYLLKMEEAVKHAGYFIVRFDQEKWKHRLYRFLGRVSDYKGDFKRAITYYRKSLKYAKTDPEYLEFRYPRWFEVEAFLSYSLIMSGKTSEGHTKARQIFQKFDTDKEALFLKKNDYKTWAIWKTGIPIRTINALIVKRIAFNKKDALIWLKESGKILKDSDLKYRLEEINFLLKRLKEVN